MPEAGASPWKARRYRWKWSVSAHSMYQPFIEVLLISADRIHSPGVKGMTTNDTFQSEESSPNRSEFFDSVSHIFGTSWRKPACRREQRGYETLVAGEH